MMKSAFNRWLQTFLDEKGIDLEQGFTVSGPSGANHMQYAHVVNAIMDRAPPQEQRAIKDVLVRIDFRNGDVRAYLRHLAQAIAL
jgi:hypothetical protein